MAKREENPKINFRTKTVEFKQAVRSDDAD